MRRAFLVYALFLLLSLPAFGIGETLYVRPWCELDPWVRVGADEYPLTEEIASRRILEEARTLFSAMVYGYTFVFTPSDASRKVSEVFELTPVAEIPWGVREIRVIETTTEGARFYARLSLALPEAEARRRSAWSSAGSVLCTGNGEASLFGGYTAKMEALKNAIKNAIRSDLSPRILNKPREVRGEVVLWEDPLTGIGSGQYKTTAKVRLRVTEIVPYRIF